MSDGFLAGVGFAVLFIGLNFAGDGSGLWPVLANELAGLVVFAVALLASCRRSSDVARRAGLPVGALVGVIGAGSSVAYFLATTAGLLSIVTVLASLYPAVTVILAILVAHEAVGRRQALGLGLACVAIALIVLARSRARRGPSGATRRHPAPRDHVRRRSSRYACARCDPA